jgi:DNA polymerase-4
MDAFFAAVEVLDDPTLAGKAFVVGHDGPRGVVSTASYEARRFGCHSAQPVAVARRLCPNLIVVPVRGERYSHYSKRLFAILEEFSPLVEPVSVDEAFLDLTGTERLFGPPDRIGRRIKERINSDTQLNASVGLAPNKFLAKTASDFDKPDGLTIVQPGREVDFLRDMPIGKLWGVGPRTAQRMAKLGVERVGDLLKFNEAELTRQFGSEGEHFARLARGEDARPVTPDHEAKSISHETTFEVNVAAAEEVRAVLLRQTELVAWRLRRAKLKAGTVTVKIRYGDFETITRSRQIDAASAASDHSDATADLWRAASALFDAWAQRSFQPVRLIGVGASRLTHGGGQMNLFPDPGGAAQQRIDTAADAVVAKFGKHAIRRGGGRAQS